MKDPCLCLVDEMERHFQMKQLLFLGFWIAFSFSILLISPGGALAEPAEEPNAPVTDLVVDGIEITQSMQDLE